MTEICFYSELAPYSNHQKQKTLTFSCTTSSSKCTNKEKKEPKFTSFKEPDSYEEELVAFKSMRSLWSILRDVNSNDQVVPAFSGFGVQDRMKEKTAVEYMKTKLTYLPPIDSN